MTRWGGGGCSVGNQFSLQPVSHLHFISSASSRPINQLCVKYCCVHCSTSTSKWCSLYLGFIKSRHRIWDLTPVKPLFITSFNAVFVVLRLWSCGLCQPSLKRQGYNQGDPVRSEKRYSQFAIYCKVTCWWLVSVNPVLLDDIDVHCSSLLLIWAFYVDYTQFKGISQCQPKMYL